MLNRRGRIIITVVSLSALIIILDCIIGFTMGGKAETDADGYMAFKMPWSLTFGYGVTMREDTRSRECPAGGDTVRSLP